MFPKASDKTFLAKLYENHMSKSDNFGKPKPVKNVRFEPHFEVYHYAGTVSWWLGWADEWGMEGRWVGELVVRLGR